MSASSPARFLLAVDPSLTASGWALFCLRKSIPLAVGVLSPPGPEEILARRLDSLQRSVLEIISRLQLGHGDYLVCEGPAPLVKNPQSALKVEGVRGIFETCARSAGLAVPGRINPRTVQSELLGMRGPQLPRKTVKDWARKAAHQMYEPQIRRMFTSEAEKQGRVPQDIIDAMLIGAVAVSRVQTALKSRTTVETVFLGNTGGRTTSRSSRNTGWTEADLRKRQSAR